MEGLPADRVGQPRVVDQAVQRAECGDLPGEPVDGRGVGDVDGHGVRVEALGAQPFGGALAALRVEFGDHHAVSVGGGPAGGGKSQSTAGAGDDDGAGRCGGHQSRVTPCIGECSG